MRLAAFAFLVTAAAPALAGDFAERELIGFSPDGSYFAFEEYGIQDGSGFPYSNVFLIETATDTWLAGTPIRVRTEQDTAELADTRFQAREQALPILGANSIGSPGNLVVSNPITELSADPHVARFLPRAVLPPIDDAWTVRIDEIVLPARNCPPGETYRGFRLTFTGNAGETRVLNEDDGIPDSRLCPLSYAVSDVLTYYPEGGRPVLVVIVSMFSFGFEGPDRRFLAVAARI